MGMLTGINHKSSASFNGIPTISVEEMNPYLEAFNALSVADSATFDGTKFVGGFGNTKVYLTDYWTLRQRSRQLFTDNIYAKGIIRRLITNEINVGLHLEATPTAEILGFDNDFVNSWSEDVENRFQIWADNPLLCDHKQLSTFGKLQADCRREALIDGDVLVIQRFDRLTNLPNIELVDGGKVQTPMGVVPRKGHVIKQGVELDAKGRHVAFWVTQKNNKSARVPAFGERSKRRTAWLVYGTEKRVDEVRGTPLLAIILQSLREIDRMRDATQRKALINSFVAMFIKKNERTLGTRPFGGGATRKDSAVITDSDGSTRNLNFGNFAPGMIFDELAFGEEPMIHSTAGTDINWGAFEASIVNAMAWGLEMPPGILTLSFHSNYSASQGEKNEFKMYLDKSRKERANEFGKPIYSSYLINEVLSRKIDAPGLIDAWRNPLQYDIFGAWIASDWAGAIKPNVDLKKEVGGYAAMVREGFITRTRGARELTNMKFSNIVKLQKTENEQLADAIRPLLNLEREYPDSKALTGILAKEGVSLDAIEDMIEDRLEDHGTPGA